jgi:hypothetical protein
MIILAIIPARMSTVGGVTDDRQRETDIENFRDRQRDRQKQKYRDRKNTRHTDLEL